MRLAPALAPGILALCAVSACAGSADIRYTHPERFADAGRGRDAERVQATLSRHLQALAAAHLPAGQTLKVEFTDIDLAGHLWPLPRSGQDIRILKGSADWPRLSLHYQLSDGAQTLARGDEDLADLGYLQRTLSLRSADALPFEQRLLREWFNRRFGKQP